MSMTENKTLGILAEFDNPNALLNAARQMRDAGYSSFDCHSPFPIHGMTEAMGEKRSYLGYIIGIMGLLGGSFALWLEWWTSAVNLPLVISGKPYFSLPAFIPIVFELTILFAAFGAVFGMLYLNRLPQLFHFTFFSDAFSKVTDDGFFVSLEAEDPKFDTERSKEFLQSIGGSSVEVLVDEESETASLTESEE